MKLQCVLANRKHEIATGYGNGPQTQRPINSTVIMMVNQQFLATNLAKRIVYRLGFLFSRGFTGSIQGCQMIFFHAKKSTLGIF
jgi:hypothetical protein